MSHEDAYLHMSATNFSSEFPIFAVLFMSTLCTNYYKVIEQLFMYTMPRLTAMRPSLRSMSDGVTLILAVQTHQLWHTRHEWKLPGKKQNCSHSGQSG